MLNNDIIPKVMRFRNTVFVLLFLLFPVFTQAQNLNVLVFTKTGGFRHTSITKGIETFKTLAKQNNWSVTFSEDAAIFEDKNFSYDVLVFLNTTGDILNDKQQEFFKNYLAKGKGFVGIHAASDTELSWPWYNDMIGATFSQHPSIQKAKLNTSIYYEAFMDADFKIRETEDEWYNFKKPVKPYVNVLTFLDEQSYSGGTMSGIHPITWFHIFEGGRIFYTGLGHQEAQYDDKIFLNELVNGIRWAGGISDYILPTILK